GGGRRGAHRPVGRHVLDLPTALSQGLGQRLGGDGGPWQQQPGDRGEQRGASTAMVGTSLGPAPWAIRRSLMSPAWSLVRGTRTVQPYSARLSHQFSFDRLATVRPIVTISGPVNGAAGSDAPILALSVSVCSVPSADRCWVVVPFAVTTHGVAPSSP